MTDNNSQLCALEPGELDLFVDSMQPSKIENIGNSAWVDWHIRLQKLNQQAVLEACSMQEEQTKEALISSGKLPLLVREAICIQVWRIKIYPQILKLQPVQSNTFGIYMVLYHEAVAVGLLETVLFHEDGAQCVSEVMVDLLDYAVEQLASLLVLINSGYLKIVSAKKLETETILDELDRQKSDLQFDIGMRCISIVRYLAEHMDGAGVSATLSSNLYKIHDLPSLLAHLIELEPWRKIDDEGNLQTFTFGRWTKPSGQDDGEMHRSEAQLWLCLRQLLLEPRLADHYAIDDVRRSAFCRLQARLTETMIDQIPPLGELKAFLCQLSLGDYSARHINGTSSKGKGCVLVEIVPQIKESYMKQVHKHTKSLAKCHLERFNLDGSSDSRDWAKKLLDSYASEAALALDGGGAKCAKCGSKASKKCSRCKNEWYCGRECQVQQWPKHKEICDQFANLCVS